MRLVSALAVATIACGGSKAPAQHDAGGGGGGGGDGGIADSPPEPIDAPAAPAFAIVRELTDTVGMVDATGTAASFVFSNGGRPALCKIGHSPEVEAQSYAPCPDPDATGLVTVPVVATTLPSGDTRSDGRYHVYILAEDATGQHVSYDHAFYVHRTLNGAARCPADPAKWPTDAEFFDEAVKVFTAAALKSLPPWMDPQTHMGALPHAVAFDMTGSAASVDAPFYGLHFDGVTLAQYRTVASPGSDFAGCVGVNQCIATEPTTASFDVPMWSLRHHVALSADGTLAVIYRSYESRAAAEFRATPGLCTMPTKFGFGLVQTFDCDALVLNSTGEGFCMTVDDEGAPHQAVFARQLVAKLMAESIGEDFPDAHDDTVWGPKLFSPVNAEFPDTMTSVEGTQADGNGKRHNHSHAVILRP